MSHFDIPQKTLSWAEQAIHEFIAEELDYVRQAAPDFLIWTEQNHTTGLTEQKIKFTGKVPAQLERKATEAIQSIKNAFDQSTYAAMKTLGHSFRGYFPWADCPTKISVACKNNKIDASLTQVFVDLAPYPQSPSWSGGDTISKALSSLANRKHDVGLTIRMMTPSLEMGAFQFPRTVGSFAIKHPTFNPDTNEAVIAEWSGSLPKTPGYKIDLTTSIMSPELVDISARDALIHYIQRSMEALNALRLATEG